MIRLAKKTDLTAIAKLARKTWEITYSNILSLDQMEYMLQKMYNEKSLLFAMTAKNHEFLVYESENQLLGFLSAEHGFEKIKTRIHKIYVHPDSQGLGIGKQLMNFIENSGKSNQAIVLNLNVNKYNKALVFYKHIGFDVVKEEIINIGSGYIMDDYVLERTIQ